MLKSALARAGRSVISSKRYQENFVNLPFQKGRKEMATKINRAVTINGEKKWVHAHSEQEYAEKLAKLFGAGQESKAPEPESKGKHPFREYALNWYEVYSKPNVETATATTYKRQLNLYLLPAFGHKAVEDISSPDGSRSPVRRASSPRNTASIRCGT